MASFSPAAPTIYQSDPFAAFKDAYGVSSGMKNEQDAKQSLSALAGGLEQPAATPDAPPPLTQFGLPDRDTLIGLLRNPDTRQQGVDLIKQATDARAQATDPANQLKLQQLQYQVQHQGDAPVDTTSRDAATRFKLGMQQGLTGDALKSYTLTGKLSDGSNARGITPSGYRWTPDGQTLQPIPGGPADPDSAQAISPEALDLISTQYLAGDKSAITGYARNANMRAQIANAVAAKANAQGMDGKAIAAEISAYSGNVSAQRSAGTRAAQVGMAASEANQMADIALDASKEVPRGSFVPLNAAMNAVQTGTSSPEMAAFVTATTSLVNAYARAVSPLGAPTDAMRQHAEQMLNTAQGPEAYAAVIAQMKKEMQAALDAPEEISNNLKTNITGQPAAGGSGPGAADNDPLGIR